MSTRLDRLEIWALASVAVCVCVVTAVVTVGASSSEHDWLEALARSATVGVPIAVGLYARQRPPFERFGMLLILAGLGWFVTTLAESRDPLLYSLGRVAGWAMEATLVYLVLAFPTGRLRDGADRVLVSAAALLVLVLYLPTALVVEQFPVPAVWTSCETGCPDNAFTVTASEPAVVEDLVRPAREVLTVVLFAAVALRLVGRIAGASRLARRTQAPLLAVASLRLVAYCAAIAGRRSAPGSEVVEAALWVLALGVALLAVAFLVGLVRWRLFVAEAMQRLAFRLRAHPGPEELRGALAEAFEDPTLEIVYRAAEEDGGWQDATGRPVRLPRRGPDRWVTEVRDDGRPVAAIVHDSALRDEVAFVDGAASYAVMTLDNHRLSLQTASLLHEVSESRARIQRSADDERRRIERDLHDGAQQRLVALRINLELAAERLGGDPSAELLYGLGTEVDQLLDEVRSLAREIYPAPLADHGLADALRWAALQSPLPTTVVAVGVDRRRFSREVESAVYFSCLEALQNAGKHAHGARAVVIELSDHGPLRFDVRDDGHGFDPRRANGGVGLTSMRDRLEAVGGELVVISTPGKGTRVVGTIPVADSPAGSRAQALGRSLTLRRSERTR